MPPEKPLELIKGFIKISGYKFNVEKNQLYFYMLRVNYSIERPGIHLTKEVKDLILEITKH